MRSVEGHFPRSSAEQTTPVPEGQGDVLFDPMCVNVTEPQAAQGAVTRSSQVT